jgi:hypothetical protein
MPPDQHDYPSVECLFAAMVTAIEAIHQNEDSTCNFLHPSACLTNTEKDTLHYGEMLQAEDRPKFIEAMWSRDHHSLTTLSPCRQYGLFAEKEIQTGPLASGRQDSMPTVAGSNTE